MIVVLLLLLQFYPRAKDNVKGSQAKHIATLYPVPDSVERLLSVACYDCHSNSTSYPWYYNIQPLAWWLDDHITEGKKELNFSDFAGYNLAKQYHKLEEVEEFVNEDAMPLQSYTITHRAANLTETQKKTLVEWVAGIRAAMKTRYPADSLIRKKK